MYVEIKHSYVLVLRQKKQAGTDSVMIVIQIADVDAFSFVQVRTRGLPDDHVRAVRVVTIEGIDTNMCCGTHVSSLSHLQVTSLA